MMALGYARISMPTTSSTCPGPVSDRLPRAASRLLLRRALAVPVMLAAALGPGSAPSAGAAPSPTPTPVVLPAATSTIGGEVLRGGGLLLDLAPGGTAPPPVQAATWLLADLTTGDVIAAAHPHVPLAPASTLKILTALTLIPKLNPNTVYTAVAADAAIDGTKVGLVPGSRYRVADLEHGLLMASGNDTANALATLGGGMAATTAAMRRRAAELQACDTVPVNDSGLDAPGQVTSAYDLALLGRAALAEPAIAALVRTTAYYFPAAGGVFDPRRKRYQIQNHNRLLRNYPGATGVKNGFTDAARGSLVGSATRGGHSYLVSLLRTEGRNWHDAAALLDWAFGTGAKARPVGRLVDPLPAGAAAVCVTSGTAAGASAPASAAPTGSGSDQAERLAGAAATQPAGVSNTVTDQTWRQPIGWALGVAGLSGAAFLIARRRAPGPRRRRRP
jgi:serine-type D-Ala-D-Ala carboxypeptidase (penicillin-binding protein 5/6)